MKTDQKQNLEEIANIIVYPLMTPFWLIPLKKQFATNPKWNSFFENTIDQISYLITPCYLGSFSTNYIVFRKYWKFSKNIFSKRIFLWSKIKNLYYEYSMFKMESSKFVNDSANMGWSCQDSAVFIDAQFTIYIIETQLAQCSHYSPHTITLHNGNQAVHKPGM